MRSGVFARRSRARRNGGTKKRAAGALFLLRRSRKSFLSEAQKVPPGRRESAVNSSCAVTPNYIYRRNSKRRHNSFIFKERCREVAFCCVGKNSYNSLTLSELFRELLCGGNVSTARNTAHYTFKAS